MDKELLISVIVPVYNGEKTVARAIESVLCQMDGRIELILVDDGSKDSSGAICDEYADKYPNIHVIHKENGGLSTARNAGILSSHGLYLSFLDCDDTVEPTTYAEIIPILLEHSPDCLDFGYCYIDNQGTAIPTIHQLPKNQLLAKTVLNEVILPPLLNLRSDKEHFIFDFVWNKLYKTELIRQNHVYFDEDRRIWEDRIFVVSHLKYCENYYCMDRCFYNYFFTPNSLSQQYSLDNFRIILSNYCHYRKLFESRFDFNIQYVCDYWSRAIENMIFLSLKQTENRELIQQNILDTLQDRMVIHWFSQRTTTSVFENNVSKLIADGNAAMALAAYQQEVSARQKHQNWKALKFKIKIYIKKLIGR